MNGIIIVIIITILIRNAKERHCGIFSTDVTHLKFVFTKSFLLLFEEKKL